MFKLNDSIIKNKAFDKHPSGFELMRQFIYKYPF